MCKFWGQPLFKATKQQLNNTWTIFWRWKMSKYLCGGSHWGHLHDDHGRYHTRFGWGCAHVSMWWFAMRPFTLWPWPVPHPVWLRLHTRHLINTCSVTSLTLSLLQTHYLSAMMFTNLALLEFSKSQSNIGWCTRQFLPCSALLPSRAKWASLP